MSVSDRIRDLLWMFKRSRRAHVLAVVAVILAVAGVLGFLAWDREGNENLTIRNGDENPNRFVEGRRSLDGLVVPEGEQSPMPVVVMLDNLAVDSVRPQAGLVKASVIYEALAEGGVTRLMPVFPAGVQVSEIGPIRSARPYFVQIAREYNGLFFHVGGSPRAQEDLRSAEDLVNIDELNLGHPYFRRDPKRSAPHNLTTNHTLIQYAIRDHGAPSSVAIDAWKFAEEEGKADVADHVLSIDFSTTSYKVEWKYDRALNAFRRFNGGALIKDRGSDEEVLAKNIIVQFVATSVADGNRLEIDLVGEGGALVFQNGVMVNATWKKPTDDSRTRFFSEESEEIVLNPGQTWVELLPVDGRVEYE